MGQLAENSPYVNRYLIRPDTQLTSDLRARAPGRAESHYFGFSLAEGLREQHCLAIDARAHAFVQVGRNVRVQDGPALECLAHRAQESRARAALQDSCVGARPQARKQRTRAWVDRSEYHARGTGLGFQCLGNTQPVNLRHVQVDQDDRGPQALNVTKCLDRIRRLSDNFDTWLCAEDGSQAGSRGSLIVDDEHTHQVARGAPTAQRGRRRTCGPNHLNPACMLRPA
jgi:hypothetical protein